MQACIEIPYLYFDRFLERNNLSNLTSFIFPLPPPSGLQDMAWPSQSAVALLSPHLFVIFTRSLWMMLKLTFLPSVQRMGISRNGQGRAF